MFEAVGEAYLAVLLRGTLKKRCLKPGGGLLQTIVIADRLFVPLRAGTDFIQQYIFPGGMLPSPAAFARRAHAAGLESSRRAASGQDYARTLATWRSVVPSEPGSFRALGLTTASCASGTLSAYCEGRFSRENTRCHSSTAVPR